MTTQMNQHEAFTNQIGAYLAGGLSREERGEFETHRAQCATCRANLEEADKLDRQMRELFSEVKPNDGFEDRVIRRLREAPRRKAWIHPFARPLASGIAAAIVLGGVGY